MKLISFLLFFSLITVSLQSQHKSIISTVVKDSLKRKFKGELYYLNDSVVVLKAFDSNNLVKFPMQKIRYFRLGNMLKYYTHFGLWSAAIAGVSYASMINQEYVGSGDFYFQPMFGSLAIAFIAPNAANITCRNIPDITYSPRTSKREKLIRIQQFSLKKELTDELPQLYSETTPKAFNTRRTDLFYTAGINYFSGFSLNKKSLNSFFLLENKLSRNAENPIAIPFNALLNFRLNKKLDLGVEVGWFKHSEWLNNNLYNSYFGYKRGTAFFTLNYTPYVQKLTQNLAFSGAISGGFSVNYVGSQVNLWLVGVNYPEHFAPEFYSNKAGFRIGAVTGTELAITLNNRYSLCGGLKFHFFNTQKADEYTYTNLNDGSKLFFNETNFLAAELLPFFGIRYSY